MIKRFSKLASTQETAKEMIRNGAKPWTVVVADIQETGHGKDRAKWYSPSGGLYFSVIIPKSNLDDLQTLTILVAFVIANTLKKNFNIEPMIKLPNDVYLSNKKICGILTENIVGREVKASVMGIGINTNIDQVPDEVKDTATSLKKEIKKNIDNQKLLKEIISGLKRQLKIIS